MKCPSCSSDMLFLYGCGWDYDRWVCGSRDCNEEIELDTTTHIEDES